MDIVPRPARQLRHMNRPALDARTVSHRPQQRHSALPMDVVRSATARVQPVTTKPKPPVHLTAPCAITAHRPPVSKSPLLAPVARVTTPRPVKLTPPVPQRKLHTNVLVVYGMAAMVFVAGLGITLQGLFVNHEVIQQTKALSSATPSTDSTEQTTTAATVPSEEKPRGDYIGTYRVAADLPRVLRIARLGVTARVLQVGVDANNQLQTPRSIYDTAWYTGSAKPGEAGAMVLDGHYSGPTTHGVFSKLDKLVAGDSITIEKGDGTLLSYEVREVTTVPVDRVDMNKLMVSVETARPGLNLITCGGAYDARSNEFADRTIVYAVQK